MAQAMAMVRTVTLPVFHAPVKLPLDFGRKFSEKECLAFCRANPSLGGERSAEGESLIMPPAGGESSYRSHDVAMELGIWARKDKRGKAFDSSAEFILPDGSGLSPDAA